MIGTSTARKGREKPRYRVPAFSFSVLMLFAVPGVLVLGALLGMRLPALMATSKVGSTNAGGILVSLSPIAIWGVTICGLLLVLLFFLRQYELLMMLIMMVHVYVDWYLGMTFIGIMIAVGLMFTLFLVRSPEYPWVAPGLRMLWLWGVLFALAFFPTLRAPSLLYGADYYVNIFVGGLLFLWLGYLLARDSTRLQRVFQLLAIFGTLIAIHTIIQTVTGKFLLGSSRHDATNTIISYLDASGSAPGVHRAESFLTNADTNGTFFAVMVFVPLSLFVTAKSLLAKLVYLVPTFLMLMAMLFTYSTGAWAAAFVGLGAFLVLVGRAKLRNQLIAMVVLVAILVLILFPTQISLQLSHASDASGLSLRNAAWETGLQVIKAVPWSGLGIGRDVYWLSADQYRVPAQYTPLYHPHNSYIELAALGGIPVALVFFALVFVYCWMAVKVCLQADREIRPLLAGGIAIAATLCFNSFVNAVWTLAPLSAIGWLMLGLAGSPLNLKEKQAQIAEQLAKMPGFKRFGPEPGSIRSLEPARLSRVVSRQLMAREEVAPRVFRGFGTPHAQGELPIEFQETTPLRAITAKVKAQAKRAEHYLVLIRELLKSSGIYALGSLASPLVALVLAPFLTRSLSQMEYGALAVLNTTVALLAGITQLGMGAAFFRAYNYDYERPRDRLAVLSTSVLLLSAATVPVALILVLAAPLLSQALFGSPALDWAIRCAALAILAQNLSIPGFSWLRAEKKAAFSAFLSIANLLVTLGATLLFVGPLQFGVKGSLLGIACGYATVVIFTLPLILVRAGLRFKLAIAKSLFLFGGPIVLSVVSVWVLQLSDRYLLSIFGSLTQTATYTVAYTLGGVLSPVVLTPFNLAWPPTMYSIAKRKDALKVFQLVFRWYSLFLLFATFGLSLASIVILDLLFPSAYHAATLVIPLVALSTMFYGISSIFSIGIYIQRKTKYSMILTAISALVNVGLNLFLIPMYGAMGAAAATLIAYGALMILIYFVNQRIYHVPFEIGLFTFALFLGVGLFAGSYYLTLADGLLLRMSIFSVVLLGYGACLGLLGKFVGKNKSNPAEPQKFERKHEVA